MGLESTTYISGLNSANPTTSDLKTQGDDHIRLIKSTLLATFPNVTGAVTPTHTELNYVDGVTSAIQTQLAARATLSGSQTFTGACKFSSNNGLTVYNASDPTHGALVLSLDGTKFVANSGGFYVFNDQGIYVFGASTIIGGLSISGTCTATAYVTSSDRRLKYDIFAIKDSGALLDALTGYRFTFIDGDRPSMGFIAQEVQQVAPQLVSESEDGYLRLSQMPLIAVLWEEVKSHRKRIADLEAKLGMR